MFLEQKMHLKTEEKPQFYPKKILKNVVSGAKMGGFEADIMVALL